MEDSFRVRVDKAFGSLGGGDVAASPSSAGVSSSMWCLTDEEIERREWNRSKEEVEDERRGEGVESVSSSVRIHLESDLQELSDYEEEDDGEGGNTGAERRKRRRDDDNHSAENDADEYLDIQSNIGRDCTLDFEEEEDGYDKMAVGDEHKGDRIYMRDVKSADHNINDYGAYDELPNSFEDFVKDPRANHEAAKMRLKEDAEAAGNFDTLQLSDNSATTNAHAEGLKKGEINGDNPKPILKKRENLIDSRSQKRVRFMMDSKDSTQIHEENQSSGASGFSSEPDSRDYGVALEQVSDYPQDSSCVPDYLRNPSKYTRYTFDSLEDMDDQSNQKACMDLFQYLKNRNSNSSVDDTPAESPKSITFIPKKKPEDSLSVKRSDSERNTQDGGHKKKGWSIGITAEEAEGSGASAMDEDEASELSDQSYHLQKPGRQYRSRTNVNADNP